MGDMYSDKDLDAQINQYMYVQKKLRKYYYAWLHTS